MTSQLFASSSLILQTVIILYLITSFQCPETICITITCKFHQPDAWRYDYLSSVRNKVFPGISFLSVRVSFCSSYFLLYVINTVRKFNASHEFIQTKFNV